MKIDSLKMEELKMKINSVNIEELSYEEAKKFKAFLLKLREIVSHGKGSAISYICYSFYLVLVGCQMI